MPNKQYYLNNREHVLRICSDYNKTKRGKEVHQRAVKKFKEKNPGIATIYSRAYREKRRQFLRNYKLSKGCSFCGYNKCADALEFHHKENKKFNVNTASSKSIKSIKEEIKKCVVLCSNCHRELHEEERNNG